MIENLNSRDKNWIHRLFQTALDVGGPRADRYEVKEVCREFYEKALGWKPCAPCGGPGFLGCRKCDGVGWYEPHELETDHE